MVNVFDPLWPELYRKQLLRQYQGRNVLVLGADGFLGANCTVILNMLGANITVLSRRDRSRVENYASKVVNGDMNDIELVKELVKNQDIIFDFVGNTGAVESNRESYDNFRVECQPHLNLFKSCADLNPKVVVMFCSSRLVYGKPNYLPVDESHALSPESLYAVHKGTLEGYLHVFAKTAGLRSTIVRLSNPYGPNMEEKDCNYGLINIFLQKALRKEAITVFGDGSQCRDYIHVRDVISAFLSSAISPNCHGQTFNLGGDTTISIREVAEIITRVVGNPPIKFVKWPEEDKLVETGDYCSDLSKINSMVSCPKQLPLKETLSNIAHWYSGPDIDINFKPVEPYLHNVSQ